MRIFTFLLFLAISSQLSAVSPVMAHFVKSDNSVGAVMHVDPKDAPVALEQSSIILEFKDIEGIFNLAKCECFLTVNLESEQIIQTSLTPVSENEKVSAVVPIIFPKKGIYEIKISGQPKEDVDFKSFELTFKTTVSKESLPKESEQINSDPKSRSRFPDDITYLAGGLGFLTVLIFTLFKLHKKRKVAE